MNNEIEIYKDQIERLERRVARCEEIAKQYADMYKQLETKMRALSDKEGNIQALYDYLTKVGSSLNKKKLGNQKWLNENDDPKRLKVPHKFSVGDTVWCAYEREQYVRQHVVDHIDFFGGHPRYCLSETFGYTDESKLFATDNEAREQLELWKDNSEQYRW